METLANHSVLNLKKVVPAKLRLDVYNEALSVLLSGDYLRFESLGDHLGLCLMFPSILFNCKACDWTKFEGERAWHWSETTSAFPEFTEEMYDALNDLNDDMVVAVRIEFVKEMIAEVKSKLQK